MNNSRYRVEIRNGSGQLIADLSGRALRRRIEKRRNRGDNIILSYDADDILRLAKSINANIWTDLLAENINEVRVIRDDTVIAAGQLSYAYPRIEEGDKRIIDIRTTSWLDLLAKRFTATPYTFSGIDAGTIGWTLINDTQNLTDGNFGITQGVIQTSVNRDRTYEIDKNIYQLLVQLSEVQNGFDFEVTWNKVFNVYYPRIGSRRTDITFTYPGNIRSIGFERDGMQMANQIIGRGQGTGADVLKSAATDTVLRGIYKLRQDIVDWPDVVLLQTLTEHANGELTDRKRFLDIPDLTLDGTSNPVYGTYQIGDEVQIRVENNDLFAPINDYFRIDATTLEIDQNDKETVSLRMTRI